MLQIMKNRLGFNFFDIFVYVFCIIFGIIAFYPVWYVFLGSISPYNNVTQTSFLLFPTYRPTFEYYIQIFSRDVFQTALAVSLIKTILSSGGSLTITSMTAYAVSKKNIRGMSTINVLIIFTMFFGGGLIPYYLLLRSLSILGTFWGMIVPCLFGTSNFIIMRNYYSYSVSHALEDAAVIDGANDIVVFFRIIVPLSLPVIAALLLFESVANWNDWYTYLIYVDNARYMPFMFMVQRTLRDTGYIFNSASINDMTVQRVFPPLSLKMTLIMVSMIPIFIFYPFLQKYFTKGIMIGAVKE